MKDKFISINSEKYSTIKNNDNPKQSFISKRKIGEGKSIKFDRRMEFSQVNNRDRKW